MDKRQKNNLMTTIALIVVFGQFVLWIILLLFECFIEAIEKNPKIDLIKYINQEIEEIGDTQHRIILRYDNEFIPVVKNIIADFNLTNNIKS